MGPICFSVVKKNVLRLSVVYDAWRLTIQIPTRILETAQAKVYTRHRLGFIWGSFEALGYCNETRSTVIGYTLSAT